MQSSAPLIDTDVAVTDACAVAAKEHKVVINLNSGIVLKGHVASTNGSDPESLFDGGNLAEIEVRLLETNERVKVRVSEVKAVFVVRSFHGNSKRRALRFYTNGPELGPIWAEIRFKDNEVVEGKVENTISHLLGNGIVMHPTDSDGNNILMYVNKDAVCGYRILGVRPR